MPYIPLENHLPGITGLLEYRQDTGKPIRELTQVLLRGPSSMSEGERELIATLVSSRNQCTFCMNAHSATANELIGDTTTSEILKHDFNKIPVSDKMKSLLAIAAKVQEGGQNVTPESIEIAKQSGATDLEIHDTVLIAALFCMYNRYVDGLRAFTPGEPEYYQSLARRLVINGYNRLTGGYDFLKK